MRGKIFIFLLLFFPLYSFSQEIPVGTWRTHLSYQPITCLANTPNRLYVGTSNGLFYLDKESNEITVLSNQNGLKATPIVKLVYDSSQDVLLIVYEDAELAILKDNQISIISTLQNISTSFEKKIYQTSLYKNNIYLSTSFGLVVFSISSMEVKEIYYQIGMNASNLEVYSSAVYQNNLYIVTNEGVKSGSLNSKVNLLDFKNWGKITSPPGVSSTTPFMIASNNNQLYAAVDNNGVYQFQENKWTQIDSPPIHTISSFDFSVDQLTICQNENVFLQNGNEFILFQHDLIKKPRDAFFESTNRGWIVDEISGLLSFQNGIIDQIKLNSPAINSISHLSFSNKKINAWSQGYDASIQAKNNEIKIASFQEGQWENGNLSGYKDLTAILFNSFDQKTYYSSFQQGLVQQNEDQSLEVFNQNNSTLVKSIAIPSAVSVTDLAIDEQGNTWVINYAVPSSSPSLHCKKIDGAWQSFNINTNAARFPLQLAIDYNGYKWISISMAGGGGIILFDDQSSQFRYFTDVSGQGKLPSKKINDIAIDKDGLIWVATESGVAFTPSSFYLFSTHFEFSFPIYEGTFLFRNRSVSCIQVDGANRKWIGTSDGLWLFSSDGSELITHFTAENSFLLSNKILDLTIHPQTGELFISTDKGLCSYRTDATEPASTFQLKIFPNPVSIFSKNIITITGLPAQSSIKITDMMGNLIYETISNGGTATWNIASSRVREGVYLLLVRDQEGNQSIGGKIAIIN